MDDASSGDRNRKTLAKHRIFRRNGDVKSGFYNRRESGAKGGDGNDEEEYDVEVWDTLCKSFNQVESVLDQNKALIQQVNQNQQSKIPDNLVKNVALIREINGNISKVVSLYSDLTVNFSSLVHQRRAALKISSSNGDGNSNSNSKDGEMPGKTVE